VGVLVIGVFVFTVFFCIVFTVFLYFFVYVYLFLFVLSLLVQELLPPSDNLIAVNNNIILIGYCAKKLVYIDIYCLLRGP
jgi:hypothetical protein